MVLLEGCDSNVKRSTIVATAVISTLAIGGTAAYASYSWTHRSKITIETEDVTEPTVKISGSVIGMLPGDIKSLTAAIRNSNDFPVRVTKMSGGTPATRSGCPEWAIRVKEPAKSDPALLVPARSSRKITVRVEMQKWADQKCAGQEFVLDLVTLIEPA
jgi:hypothetical protein